MTTRDCSLIIPPKDLTVVGHSQTNVSNGTLNLSIPASGSARVVSRFSLPHTDAASKGYQLNGVSCHYEVVSGTLASVNNTLNRLLYRDNVTPVANTIAITTPAAGAANGPDLTASNHCRMRSDIDTPAFDNQEVDLVAPQNTIAVQYLHITIFTASAAGAVNLTLFGNEADYVLDWA